MPSTLTSQQYVRGRSRLRVSEAKLIARPKCPQPSEFNNTGDFGPHIPFPDCGEDEFRCLNLNVYAPVQGNGEESKLLPVLVWIHGYVMHLSRNVSSVVLTCRGSLLFGAGSDPIWGEWMSRWSSQP